jgi:hypothetical protein
MRKYRYPLYDAATQEDAGTLKITAENVEEADEKAFAWQRANPGYDVDILRARSEVVEVPYLGVVEL